MDHQINAPLSSAQPESASFSNSADSAAADGLPGFPHDDTLDQWLPARISTLAGGLNAAHVQAAAERLIGQVIRTPVLRCDALDQMAGAELWLKAENLQHVGAFKARGALHMIGKLPANLRAQGVVTYSSGNHGQAVAYAASRYGIKATIVMPVDAPAVKVAAVQQLGAQILFAGHTSAERRAAAQEVLARQGGVMVPPFDHPDIIVGQGTVALELFEHVATAAGDIPAPTLSVAPVLDALYVPVGGGGLVAGSCLAARGRNIPIIGVEPRGCESLGAARLAGRRVTITPSASIADGLRPVAVGALNFAIVDRDIHDCVVVNDEAIAQATIALLLSAKVLAEPSGATALAGAIAHARTLTRPPGRARPRVGVILSGGNIDPMRLQALLHTSLADHSG